MEEAYGTGYPYISTVDRQLVATVSGSATASDIAGAGEIVSDMIPAQNTKCTIPKTSTQISQWNNPLNVCIE